MELQLIECLSAGYHCGLLYRERLTKTELLARKHGWEEPGGGGLFTVKESRVTSRMQGG